MAGLWERWTASTKQTGLDDFGSDGSSCEQGPPETFAVVTTEPDDLVSELHHRVAVVLAPEDEQTWLHDDPDEAAALLDTYPDDELTAYPVSTRVNSPANDGPDLIERVEAQRRVKSLASGRLSDFDANRPGSTGSRISRAQSNPRTRIMYSEIEYTSLESDKPPAAEAFRESGIESR